MRHEGEHSVILTLAVPLLMTLEYLIEGAVILGTTKGQPLVPVAFILPGSQAFEPDMTDEFVRRLDPTTPQRIAASAELTIVEIIRICISNSRIEP
jgi:hypothetical protein